MLVAPNCSILHKCIQCITPVFNEVPHPLLGKELQEQVSYHQFSAMQLTVKKQLVINFV